MVQTVKIRKGDKIIRVHFIYNTDLVDIMHDHRGWWFRQEKAWQFPLWKLEPLYDQLTKEHYRVEITKLIESPKKKSKPKPLPKIDQWKEKDVMAVWGKCKKCGHVGYVNKNEICVRCSWGIKWIKKKEK